MNNQIPKRLLSHLENPESLQTLQGIACRILGNPADAEDIVQSVFLSVLEGRARTYDSSKPPAPWLRRIVQNKCIDYLRQRATHTKALGEISYRFSQNHVSPPDQQLIDSEGQQRLRNCLPFLTKHHQRLIALRYHLGESVREVASALGIPEGTVKSQTHHALAHLRESYQP